MRLGVDILNWRREAVYLYKRWATAQKYPSVFHLIFMLQKGSFKLLPPSHWHECVLHMVTLKQSLQGRSSCEQRGGETGKQPLCNATPGYELWLFHTNPANKDIPSQNTNPHELWDCESPVFSALTDGSKGYKSRLKLPPLPSSHPCTASQGIHISSCCQPAVTVNQDLLGVFYKHIMHQHLKQQEEEHAVKTTK